MLDQARLNTDYQVRPAVAVVGWWWLGLVCVFGVYVCNVYVEWACCAGKEGAPRRRSVSLLRGTHRRAQECRKGVYPLLGPRVV